ncbi:hypothetical protein SAMN04489801_6193 [Pseudomonas mandelii]|uniref:Uncharacterized protein n=1 Tax=Pseudomonas mandelii TaxID=75612 RepID=A0ABY0W2D3_9PSED|nr:hypothetical protein SAMN04489801_6193 [Pseudomonas mandelii]
MTFESQYSGPERLHTPRCRDSGQQYVIDNLFYTGY